MPGSSSPPPVPIHEVQGYRLQVLSVISRHARTERSQLRIFRSSNRHSQMNCEPEFFSRNLRLVPRLGVAPQRDPDDGARSAGADNKIPTELGGLTGKGTGSIHETAWCVASELASSIDAAAVMTREPDRHLHQVGMDRIEQTSRCSTACRRSLEIQRRAPHCSASRPGRSGARSYPAAGRALAAYSCARPRPPQPRAPAKGLSQ